MVVGVLVVDWWFVVGWSIGSDRISSGSGGFGVVVWGLSFGQSAQLFLCVIYLYGDRCCRC